ncbi:MAG: hypothetical protein LBG48_02385 [Rickettsiales bacterium]|jgi:DNA ligase-1|nr:hypothetical protein [Rickettsiales bacterium]
MFKNIFEYQLRPDMTFGITGDNVKKYNGESERFFGSLFAFTDYLILRMYTGNQALAIAKWFCEANNVLYDWFNRDLKIRVGLKEINKVLDKDNQIPEFSVSLGFPFKDYKDKIDFTKDEWYLSRKLDGMRLITFINEGCEGIKFLSREGKEKTQFDNLRPYISDFFKLDNVITMVLDGEVCRVKDDKEDFQRISKEINKKDYQAPIIDEDGYKLIYNIFDVLTIEDFNKRTSGEKFLERQKFLDENCKINDHVKIIEQKKFNGEIPDIPEGWEGFILRKNDIYQGKRHKDLLKVKEMEDAEFEVLRIEKGVKPILFQNKWIDVEVMAAAIVNYDGYEVRVGSGFSDSQRMLFNEYPAEIVGHKIKVKYFEKTTDKNGDKSLRFPIFVEIRDELM